MKLNNPIKQTAHRNRAINSSKRGANVRRARGFGLDTNFANGIKSNKSLTFEQPTKQDITQTLDDIIDAHFNKRPRIVRRYSRTAKMLGENVQVHEEVKSAYKHLTLASELTDEQRDELKRACVFPKPIHVPFWQVNFTVLQVLLERCYRNVTK